MVRSRGILVIRIYIQWMCLLTIWFRLSWRWLPHSNKLSLLAWSSIDNLSSRRKHAVINLVVLCHLIARATIAVYLVGWLLDLSIWGVFLYTTHSLTSCTEETFHAVKVYDSLHSLWALLWFFLYSMNLAIFLTYIIVAKPILLLILPLWGLHLRFESIVNTLSLRKRMVHVFWACNLVHSHIGTHRHALVDLTMSSRRQRISPILSFYISSGRDVTVAAMSGAMRPIVGLISWFHHRWKL